MKCGDLVRIKENGRVGVITSFVSFEKGKNPQPVVMIEGRQMMYGHLACEVISESQ